MANLDFKAEQKYIVSSPKKLRVVASMIKKLKPVDAVERLPFSGKRGSIHLIKVIKSAIANAKVKNVSPTDLIFKEILINEGPRLKRFHAGSRGRAKPYKKRMSHIRVVLTTRKLQILNNKSETIQKSEKQEVNLDEKMTVKAKTNNDKSKFKGKLKAK